MLEEQTVSTRQSRGSRPLIRHLRWTLLVICVLAVTGCNLAAPPTPEPVTIRFAHSTLEIDRAQYEALIAKFNESYPHITVELLHWPPWQPINDLSGVDTLMVYGGLAPLLQEQESITSLDGFIQRDESFDLADMHPGAAAYLQDEGQTWAVPAGITVNAIFYNKDLFDQYGVPYPEDGWTWDGFFEKALLLTNPSDGVYGYASLGEANGPLLGGFDALEFIYQHGGTIVDDLNDPTDVRFDDPLTIEALDWYARLIHEHERDQVMGG
jgi:ABC-type glycerol-3-phosphate transport system substrate-binding protein